MSNESTLNERAETLTIGDTQSLSAALVIAALTSWLNSRHGRKLRIKIGDVEEVADSMEGLVKTLLSNTDNVIRASEPKRTQES